MLCRLDYSERLVASFAHKIQSEYYGGNILVYIEGISLEHFSAMEQKKLSSSSHSCTCHATFHSFLYDHRKKYATTTAAHRRQIIELSQKVKF